MDEQRDNAGRGGEEDFQQLFEQSIRTWRPGDVVRGRIVMVGRDAVTVDIGYKSEGQIPVQEFTDRDGNVCVHEGDLIDVYFDGTDTENGGIVLSRAKAEQFKVWRDIEEAFQGDGAVCFVGYSPSIQRCLDVFVKEKGVSSANTIVPALQTAP